MDIRIADNPPEVYKVIATIDWRFDSDLSLEEAKKYARERLSEILELDPFGEDYQFFNLQLDVFPLKRKKLSHLAEFSFSEFLPYVNQKKKEYKVDDKTYMVRLTSPRYSFFKEDTACVACGLLGSKLVLDMCPGDKNPHFNLYGVENGRLILITIDHIIPKAKGGKDEKSNYQVMCATCNNLKGHFNLTLKDIQDLKKIYLENKNKLPGRELRKLIQETREKMEKNNI